ncbi:hypothetical protein CVU82_03060 [Candidatus Falkowbacteria bacterium HGW-Falkowbacteria-1]|jgi:hypothetical protein|uniref:HD/PDEase domain-containing protein n=1 Tax=Candidatus Falkowbacteria bacterium HGW-Falkowbacteria-1 TaxID=2013768 RepID=A0A2N2EA25_9BACT|nr:MAG: hypothetical protein CVU82_03060 [Candidatus Falkowbacteria bacterium HGW-Falkowbacteria-1]
MSEIKESNFFSSDVEELDPESVDIKRPMELKELEMSKKFLSLIEDNFSLDDFNLISKAFSLAQEIHEDQVQPDGKAYINHPVEVASSIVENFKIYDRDLIITALLHDSLEDQSERLFAFYVEKNNFFVNTHNILSLQSFVNKFSEEIREIAFLEIRDNFGSPVAERVRRLSKPDFDSLIDSCEEEISLEKRQLIKNKMYKDYFQSLLELSDYGVGVIKCADLLNNTSKNHLLNDGPKKSKLLKKYSPVIKDVIIPFLQKMEKEHPLYEKSQIILDRFVEIYNRDFALAA